MIQGILTWLATLSTIKLLWMVMLMTMISSILPISSELVIAPAAYLANHAANTGPLFVALVILIGTIGSYLGAAISYWLSRIIGRPLIVRFGKYIFIPEKKLLIVERWVGRYGAGGIFLARLIPVVRHIISIPAGMMGLRFRTFSIMTLLGSFVWSAILTGFGLCMSRDMEIVIKGGGNGAQEQRQFDHAMNNLTWATILIVVVLLVGYLFVLWLGHKKEKAEAEQPAEQTPSCR